MVIDTKRVANVCDETFFMYKYGGTLLRRDDENFLLSDVACVTCSQIQYMQACLPQLKVQVLSSDASTSGFRDWWAGVISTDFTWILLGMDVDLLRRKG